MSTSLPPFWEDLLAYIDDRRVIPIVGAELLRIPQETGDVPLSTLLARPLAAKLGVSDADLPDDDAVHAVVCRYVNARGAGRRQELYTRLHATLSDLKNSLPTPPALRKLAAVRHFDLFVSTTYDTLLARALDEGRFGGTPKTRSVAYAPNDVQDLPGPLESFRDQPIVYHLLGRSSVAPDYAVTEEDVLEFLYALQSDDRRPRQLFKELRKRHLLLIGNRFPDWLARFFIRLAKQDRLSGQRDSMEYVADRLTHGDENLVVFLKSFSHTEIYAGGGAAEFVDELVRLYEDRHRPEFGLDSVAVPDDVPPPSRGRIKLAVCSRLVDDWRRVADFFDVPKYDRSQFARGPDDLWDWLDARGQLAELPDAFASAEICRPDLTALLRGEPWDVIPAGFVYLSHAAADREVAQQIHDRLRNRGVDVWRGRKQSTPGSDSNRLARRNVGACSLFVPVMSAQTRARSADLVWQEWDAAAARATGASAPGGSFIVPISVDDAKPSDSAALPAVFGQIPCARLPGGMVTGEFTDRIRQLVREHHKRQQRGST